MYKVRIVQWAGTPEETEKALNDALEEFYSIYKIETIGEEGTCTLIIGSSTTIDDE